MNKSIEYLAGIFDAEGCVHMPLRNVNLSSGGAIALRTTVEMIDRNPIDALNKKFPANIRIAERDNRRASYVWCITGSKSKLFMEQIYPYAIVKRPHLDLGLKFCATLNRPDLLHTRAALREKLHSIQIRGKNKKADLVIRDIPEIVADEYLFGFFDGEGCITAPVSADGIPRLRVVVANTVKTGADIFQRRWGGSVHKREPRNERCLPMYMWYLQGAACKQFLLDADGRLLVKQNQLTKGLELLMLDYDWLNACRKKVALELREMNSGQYLSNIISEIP